MCGIRISSACPGTLEAFAIWGTTFRRAFLIVTAIGARLLIEGTLQLILKLEGELMIVGHGSENLLQKFPFMNVDAT